MPPKPDLLGRRWRLEAPPDERVAAALAAGLTVPLPFARLLAQRGFADVVSARRFLKPSRQDLHDPSLLPDIDRALERLVRAVDENEPVLVHGDYDVDGQCATTILTRTIRWLGGHAVPFVPHRIRDGYDLSPAGVRAARDAGAKLIVTLDCGTTAVDAVAEARALGIDVIVVDHHLPGPTRPDALALVNPKRPESAYPFPELCGAGLSWKVSLALARAVGRGDHYVWHLLDLAALATVADLVPLTGENRAIVRLGLRVMRETAWPGLAALIAEAGLAGKTIRAGQVGFVLGPRINAVGRVGDANDGLALLLTDDATEAARLAAQLERQNAERQALDQRTLDEALEALERDYDPARDVGVVLAKEGWHPGVIGIVASRVVERIARPVFMVAFDGDVGKGSGRSVPRCNLYEALARCAPHLERWGGHKMAAGLTVQRSQLDAFRAAFNAACAAQVGPEDLVPTQRVDAILSLGDITEDFERMLRHLEPTGMGNPGPVFGLDGVELAGPTRAIGEKHVRFTLADGSARLRTVAWGVREEVERVTARGGRLKAAVKLDHDSWLGRETVEGRLVTLAAG
ncbi:MAG: single-stranded-DNA-specific exonuclease RecJ [Gemmatimonadales bacterium]